MTSPTSQAVTPTEHKWDICDLCGPMVRCGHCGNNCCNGGSGDGCPDNCASAYEMQRAGYAAFPLPEEQEELKEALDAFQNVVAAYVTNACASWNVTAARTALVALYARQREEITRRREIAMGLVDSISGYRNEFASLSSQLEHERLKEGVWEESVAATESQREADCSEAENNRFWGRTKRKQRSDTSEY